MGQQRVRGRRLTKQGQIRRGIPGIARGTTAGFLRRNREILRRLAGHGERRLRRRRLAERVENIQLCRHGVRGHGTGPLHHFLHPRRRAFPPGVGEAQTGARAQLESTGLHTQGHVVTRRPGEVGLDGGGFDDDFDFALFIFLCSAKKKKRKSKNSEFLNRNIPNFTPVFSSFKNFLFSFIWNVILNSGLQCLFKVFKISFLMVLSGNFFSIH